jgi:hypothetical protein
VEFKLYLVEEFGRLKVCERHRQSREWNLQRTLSKIDCRIQTDAIKERSVPKEVKRTQVMMMMMVYASKRRSAERGAVGHNRRRPAGAKP